MEAVLLLGRTRKSKVQYLVPLDATTVPVMETTAHLALIRLKLADGRLPQDSIPKVATGIPDP